MPSDLGRQIGAFVGFYNNQRYHESLNTVTLAGVTLAATKPSCVKGKRSKSTQSDSALATSKTSGLIICTNEPEPPMLKPF